MPNFAVTDRQIIDSINYINAGPTTNGQESKGYWNYGGGYFIWDNVYPPYIQDTVPTGPIVDGTFFRTPAYVFVKTTSTTDSVVVTSQLRPFVNFTFTDPVSDFRFIIEVYRYKVDEQVPGWYISGEKLINYELLASDNNALGATSSAAIQAGTASFGETVFCSIVDDPGIGQWMYSLELYYEIQAGDPVLNWAYGENIGLTATVIKL